MAFVLPAGEPLSTSVHHALMSQLDSIRNALGKSVGVEAVHKSRKACKRSRAAVDLLQGHLGRRKAKQLDRAIRSVARPLGPVRDADVMAIRLAEMGRTDREPAAPNRHRARKKALAALEEATARSAKLDLGSLERDALVRQLGQSWKRARNRMDETGTDGDAIHDWRKACKALGYQIGLLSERAPEALMHLLPPLDRLQETLGDHHDHFVLAELFADDAGLVKDAEKVQKRLAKRALLQGRVLFAPRPAHFSSWLTASWA